MSLKNSSRKEENQNYLSNIPTKRRNAYKSKDLLLIESHFMNILQSLEMNF